ncbi:MAG: hypothetical protein KAS32_23265 [Candidatus Peribacteraceae bacterium]|nr:hypothetical protein [Candidatus Peribacteraceae bacterium]
MSKSDLLGAPGDIIIEELDQRSKDALESIITDSDLFHTFVQGSASDTFDTENGTVDSVAKIAAELRAWRFVEVVVDAATLAIAQAYTSTETAIGGLIRVYADGDSANNGIYRVDSFDPTVITKINYVDLIDLSVLPETLTDNIIISQSGAITGTVGSPDDTYFARVEIPDNAVMSSVVLEVDYNFNDDESGGTGSITAKNYITLSGQDAATHDEVATEMVANKLGDMAAESCLIGISYYHDAVNLNHEWGIRITPPDSWQAGTVSVKTKGDNDGQLTSMLFGDVFP